MVWVMKSTILPWTSGYVLRSCSCCFLTRLAIFPALLRAAVEDGGQFFAHFLFLRAEATIESISTCVSAPLVTLVSFGLAGPSIFASRAIPSAPIVRKSRPISARALPPTAAKTKGKMEIGKE